ncbi:MAG: DUF6172 family protein [Verrucomicrobiaceae bacterium]
MKKLFPTKSGNHAPARVLDSIKAELNKYLKRERRKELPEGVDFWDFDCRVGTDEASAASCHVNELSTAIDTAASSSPEAVYVEILSKKGIRSSKPKS